MNVGLANPNACMRTVAAFQAARTVGFPERQEFLLQVLLLIYVFHLNLNHQNSY